MATDIPAITDEIPHDERVVPSSRRWLWSPWTWLGCLTAFVGLVTLLEVRILWQESIVAEELHRRGYEVEHADGWLKRLMPKQWNSSFVIFGDRIVRLNIVLESRDLEPLDDLIPQMQGLRSLEEVQLINSDDTDGPLPTSIESIDRCLVTLKKAGIVKCVTLVHFRESQLSEGLIQSLRLNEIERVVLFLSACSDSDVARLNLLPRLKQVALIRCNYSDEAIRQLKQERPDILVDVVDNPAWGFQYP